MELRLKQHLPKSRVFFHVNRNAFFFHMPNWHMGFSADAGNSDGHLESHGGRWAQRRREIEGRGGQALPGRRLGGRSDHEDLGAVQVGSGFSGYQTAGAHWVPWSWNKPTGDVASPPWNLVLKDIMVNKRVERGWFPFSEKPVLGHCQSWAARFEEAFYMSVPMKSIEDEELTFTAPGIGTSWGENWGWVIVSYSLYLGKLDGGICHPFWRLRISHGQWTLGTTGAAGTTLGDCLSD